VRIARSAAESQWGCRVLAIEPALIALHPQPVFLICTRCYLHVVVGDGVSTGAVLPQDGSHKVAEAN
jgi:hypothetical protein